MPRIIVVAECGHSSDSRAVFAERVVTAHLESEQSSAQLVERLGWAIIDADELEQAQADAAAPLSAFVGRKAREHRSACGR